MPGRSKRDRDADGLSLREALFCSLYIIQKGNGGEAARLAGYKGDCRRRACLLLKVPHVRQVIERERTRLMQKFEVKKERVLAELAYIAFADIREMFTPDGNLKNFSELSPETAAAISSFEVRHGTTKVRFNSKIHSLDLLGRYLKLWEGAGANVSDRLNEILDAFRAGPVGPKKETVQ